MDDHITAVGAYEAKTRFSELINRAKKGERFLITRQAEQELRALLARQGASVPEEAAAQNWENLKRDLETEENEQIDQWLLSSTPR